MHYTTGKAENLNESRHQQKKFIMKKYLFFAAFLTISMIGTAQESKPANTIGIGLGIGVLTIEPSILNASLNVEGDLFLSDKISFMGHIDYNRLFSFGQSGSAGFMTAHIGPRVHITEKFFAGVGIGYAYFSADGLSEGAFSYYPHIGFDFKKSQLTFNYKAITNRGNTEGMIGIGILFKFQKSKAG
jgi:hypothetical protein